VLVPVVTGTRTGDQQEETTEDENEDENDYEGCRLNERSGAVPGTQETEMLRPARFREQEHE